MKKAKLLFAILILIITQYSCSDDTTLKQKDNNYVPLSVIESISSQI